MKLRIKGNQGLFDATLLVDGPECAEAGQPAVIRIAGADGEHIIAAPSVAAQRCQMVWATPQEWHWLGEYGFLPDGAPEHDEHAS